jgi:polyhydroxyalkanoate synthesis regulator phasin
MRDAVRGYMNAASGLTELTRKRAQDLAQSLLASTGAAGGGGSVAHQVGTLAEELVSAARSNREAVREMIRGEVEMAVGRLGLVPASELAAARKQIVALESAVAELTRGRGTAARATTRVRPPRAALKKQVAPKAPATKAAVQKLPAKKAVVPNAPAKKAVVPRAAVKKAAVKKAAVKKAPAQTATMKKAPVKKTALKKTAVKQAPVKGTPGSTATAPTTPSTTAKKAAP